MSTHDRNINILTMKPTITSICKAMVSLEKGLVYNKLTTSTTSRNHAQI